nr:alkali-sensitive linkage protein 1 [Quercus suber]
MFSYDRAAVRSSRTSCCEATILCQMTIPSCLHLLRVASYDVRTMSSYLSGSAVRSVSGSESVAANPSKVLGAAACEGDGAILICRIHAKVLEAVKLRGSIEPQTRNHERRSVNEGSNSHGVPSVVMLSVSLIAVLVTSLACAQDLSSSKRGLVYIPSSDHEGDDQIWDTTASDLTWYYNYKASPSSAFANSKLAFVPMLWGAPTSDTDTTFSDTVKSLIASGTNISYVLGFNEPNGCADGGSCVDAQTAAATWIREIEPLKELGVQIGAPAVTSAESGFTWLENFFGACAGQCNPDFIPIHYYGEFQGFASHFGRVQATYQNISSIWCTEFAYPNASLQDSQDFYNQSTALMDRTANVTHYSYFGSFRSDVSNVGPNAAMLTQNGQLTDIGAWYLGEPAQVKGAIPQGGVAGSHSHRLEAETEAKAYVWSACRHNVMAGSPSRFQRCRRLFVALISRAVREDRSQCSPMDLGIPRTLKHEAVS